ncbi:MAG: hypothetical protein ACSHXK_05315 [Oceanococcus sp.]
MTLSLIAFLLLPLSQAFGGMAVSAFCGSGQTQSALALKMQRVATAELLAYLGISTSQDEHCPLCVVGGFVALLGALLFFAFGCRGQILAVQLRSIAPRSLTRYFQARAPPFFPL